MNYNNNFLGKKALCLVRKLTPEQFETMYNDMSSKDNIKVNATTPVPEMNDGKNTGFFWYHIYYETW